MDKAKILIVDDEPFNVSYLEQELEDLGYDTLSASDGIQALEMVFAAAPDLILLDIMMPLMDGFQVLEHLKGDPRTRDIPVVIISALSDFEYTIKGIEIGAEDYLPKPYDPILLRARLNNALQKHTWKIQEKRYLKQIEAEKKRADDLLHVILPDAIVQELKANDRVQPRHYPDVAVMFADVVAFTPYSESRPPQQVMSNLQTLVEAYERLAVKYGLQKIKTVGDAFVAAGGLLQPSENPVLDCVRCGLEMVTFAPTLPDPWQVRVGIDYGPVLGAVVGKQQYHFDIYGDAVNTAQRVESHGRPGAVNLTVGAWERVSEFYSAESLGLREVKGKGRMEILYILPTSIREELSDEEPN